MSSNTQTQEQGQGQQQQDQQQHQANADVVANVEITENTTSPLVDQVVPVQTNNILFANGNTTIPSVDQASADHVPVDQTAVDQINANDNSSDDDSGMIMQRKPKQPRTKAKTAKVPQIPIVTKHVRRSSSESPQAHTPTVAEALDQLIDGPPQYGDIRFPDSDSGSDTETNIGSPVSIRGGHEGFHRVPKCKDIALYREILEDESVDVVYKSWFANEIRINANPADVDYARFVKEQAEARAQAQGRRAQ